MAKLIIALDCEINRAKEIVKEVYKKNNFFKVGPVLFVNHGLEIIEFLKKYDSKIFLDLKLHDIPNTVEKAVENISRLGVYSLSVHACGGKEMLKACVGAAGKKLKIWGVTILTSIDVFEYSSLGFRYSLEHQVAHFARLLKSAGVDGIISSPREMYYLKKIINDIDFITPSIRLSTTKDIDDQKRFMTPKKAVEWGSDYLVVGRPITQSKNPLEVVDKIIEEINSAGKYD
ncbi:MAG: orotidine-5'-phosphate decarboxylase [Elusimicrobiota bacterium]